MAPKLSLSTNNNLTRVAANTRMAQMRNIFFLNKVPTRKLKIARITQIIVTEKPLYHSAKKVLKAIIEIANKASTRNLCWGKNLLVIMPAVRYTIANAIVTPAVNPSELMPKSKTSAK